MTTHVAARQELGYELHDLAVYVAGSGDANTIAIGALISADANASTHLLDGKWVFNATKRLQRKARTGGFTPATGAQIIDPPWTAPTTNDSIELTEYFPSISAVRGIDTSYQTILNRALKPLRVKRQITWSIVPGAQAYALTAAQAAWMTEARFGWPDAIMPDGTRKPHPKIMEPGPTSLAPIPADWRDPVLRLNGAAPYLEIHAPFAAGTTGVLTANVTSPADTWINLGGGGYAESTQGFANDLDETLASLSDVVTVARWIAAEVLAARGLSDATGAWADRVAEFKAAAMALEAFDRSQMAAVQAETQQTAGAAA